LKREYIVIVIVLLAIAIFPTPRSRTMQDLIQEIPYISPVNTGRYEYVYGLTDMKDETKIVVDIRGTRGTRQSYKFTLYDILWRENDLKGSIKVYHVYEVREWIPWWINELLLNQIRDVLSA